MTDVNGGMKAYGEALFSLTEELKITEKVLDDVKTLTEVINASPEYLKMLDSPALTREERLGLIDNNGSLYFFQFIDRSVFYRNVNV